MLKLPVESVVQTAGDGSHGGGGDHGLTIGLKKERIIRIGLLWAGGKLMCKQNELRQHRTEEV